MDPSSSSVLEEIEAAMQALMVDGIAGKESGKGRSME